MDDIAQQVGVLGTKQIQEVELDDGPVIWCSRHLTNARWWAHHLVS